MAQITVRQLQAEDVDDYRRVRLRALQEHPEAFASAAEEFSRRSRADIAQFLAGQSPEFRLYGAFDGQTLVGLIGLSWQGRLKTRHRAAVNHMYVRPESRGCGVGASLVQTALEEALALPTVEEVTLAVTAGNGPARRLYERCGFVFSHREPRYLKVGARYYDIDWMTLRRATEKERGEGDSAELSVREG